MKNLEKFIQDNARKVLAEKKLLQAKERVMKRNQMKRKQQLEEENRMIRIHNFNSFNQLSPVSTPVYAWGTDQRKFMHSPTKSPTTDPAQKDRIISRKKSPTAVRGQGNFSDLVFKSTIKSIISKQKESNSGKPSRDIKNSKIYDNKINSPERSRRGSKKPSIRSGSQSTDNKGAAVTKNRSPHGKINDDLVKLSQDTKKRLHKFRKASHHEPNVQKMALSGDYNHNRAMSHNIQAPFHSSQTKDIHWASDSDEDNYSFLYNEYKQIMKAKAKTKSLSPGSRTANGLIESFQFTSHRNQEQDDHARGTSDAESNVPLTLSLNGLSSSNRSKRESLKRHFIEIVDRFEKSVGPIRRFATENDQTSSIQEESPEEYISKEKEQEILQEEFQKSARLNNFAAPSSTETNFTETVVTKHSRQPPQADAAAVIIQKNFRGYQIRKMLREFFEELCSKEEAAQLQNQELDQSAHPPQDQGKEVMKEQCIEQSEKLGADVGVSEPPKSVSHEVPDSKKEKASEGYQERDQHVNMGERKWISEKRDLQESTGAINDDQLVKSVGNIRSETKLSQRGESSNLGYDQEEVTFPDYEGIDANFINEVSLSGEEMSNSEVLEVKFEEDVISSYKKRFYDWDSKPNISGSGNKKSSKFSPEEIRQTSKWSDQGDFMGRYFHSSKTAPWNAEISPLDIDPSNKNSIESQNQGSNPDMNTVIYYESPEASSLKLQEKTFEENLQRNSIQEKAYEVGELQGQQALKGEDPSKGGSNGDSLEILINENLKIEKCPEGNNEIKQNHTSLRIETDKTLKQQLETKSHPLRDMASSLATRPSGKQRSFQEILESEIQNLTLKTESKSRSDVIVEKYSPSQDLSTQGTPVIMARSSNKDTLDCEADPKSQSTQSGTKAEGNQSVNIENQVICPAHQDLEKVNESVQTSLEDFAKSPTEKTKMPLQVYEVKRLYF